MAFGILGLSVRDFQLLTPVEVMQAGRERTRMWHLQNAVNASFFTTILSSIGTKTKTGEPIQRQHLYLVPGEAFESDYIDASTEEGRRKINEMIEKVHGNSQK